MTFDELLTLEPAGPGAWRAHGVPGTDEPRPFGGLLLAQAVLAASLETRRCHSLHALFVGAGSKELAFEIGVERLRDGRSFAARRIEIRQGERLLLAAFSSHHDGDDGPEHQVAMPDVPPPEMLEDGRVMRARRAAEGGKPARRYLAETMLEARPCPPDEEGRAVWFRPRALIAGAGAMHQAAIAFASDMGLVHVGLQRHGGFGSLEAASLDHAIWFHRDVAFDDWMLHVQRALVTVHGRGLSQAAVFTRDGTLAASVTQEFLARRRPGLCPGPAGASGPRPASF